MEWKDNAPYALCLSHDVDRIGKQWYHYCYYGIKKPLSQFASLKARIRGREPYWNFETIMELEEHFGVRSTFFFLNESHRALSADFMGRYRIQSTKVMQIIRQLDDKGYEIGLHGSFDSYCDAALLRSEKVELEQILGHAVVSARQHHLNYESGKTWAFQKEIGICYDSTSGSVWKPCAEQPRRTEEGLIEIPITLMDTVALTEQVFQDCGQIARDGGIITLNFHQCHFNGIEYPRNIEIYTRFLEKAKQDGAWIANVKEIGAWLDERL